MRLQNTIHSVSPLLSKALAVQCTTSSTARLGRTAIYRRISHDIRPSLTSTTTSNCYLESARLNLFRSCNSESISFRYLQTFPLAFRLFTTNSIKFQIEIKDEAVKDPPRRNGDKAKESGAADEGPKAKSEDTSEEGQKTSGDEDSKGNERKKEDPPPPPPHGDKSPWQVFTETLRSEFKASKEWNESTKQIASSAQQFTENESVKRARAAYSAASGAATSTTATALKSTGKALGQGAAWTWETPVVKGVRAGVNATGRGLDKATKPVRETKVFKTAVGGVKDVIDDGSSSRYGGWVEKEERRKVRELRELNEAGVGGRAGKRVEKIEEDPKYVAPRYIVSRPNTIIALEPTSHCTKTRHGRSHGGTSRIPIELCNRYSR